MGVLGAGVEQERIQMDRQEVEAPIQVVPEELVVLGVAQEVAQGVALEATLEAAKEATPEELVEVDQVEILEVVVQEELTGVGVMEHLEETLLVAPEGPEVALVALVEDLIVII